MAPKVGHLTKEGLVTLIILLIIGRRGPVFPAILALLGFSLFWHLLFRLRVRAERILPKFGTVGEALEYRIIFHNPSPQFQKGLYVVENIEGERLTLDEFANTPAPDEKTRGLFERMFLSYRRQWLRLMKQGVYIQEHPIPSVPPYGEIAIRSELLPIRRGYINLSGLTIARPDPFHLSRALRRIPLRQSVLILPKRYEMPQIRLPGARKFTLGGMALVSSIGDSQEFLSLRDYRPGDSLRRIHWRSWAKTGKPVVKEYHDEYFVRHALILDTFQPAAYSDIFEEAVSLAASFACTIRTQDSLLDLMFVGTEAYCFTIGRGLGYTEQMLEILASVTPCQEKTFHTLPPLVFEHVSLLSGCICILLAWDEERRQFIRTLQILGVPMLVFILIEGTISESLEPDPIQEISGDFHVLHVGHIQEELAQL